MCKRSPDRSLSSQEQNISLNKLILDLSALFCIYHFEFKKLNQTVQPGHSVTEKGTLLSPTGCHLTVIPRYLTGILWVLTAFHRGVSLALSLRSLCSYKFFQCALPQKAITSQLWSMKPLLPGYHSLYRKKRQHRCPGAVTNGKMEDNLI